MTDKGAALSLGAGENDRVVDWRPVVQDLEDAFPEVDPGLKPTGSRLIIQIRTPHTHSKGGLIIPDNARDDDKHATQIGKVRAMGSLAFHKRDTLEPWPEGSWCKVGDFVRIPKHGGDRWTRDVPGQKGKEALFVVIEDFSLTGVLTCDPRELRTFW